MNGKPPPLSSMPDDLRDRLEDLVATYRAVRRKEDRLRARREGTMTRLRIAMGEIAGRYDERLAHLEGRRKALSAEFLDLWSRRLPGLKSVVLPSAVVRRRRDVKIAVLDKDELIDALDRMDRLDLVEEVVDEKGLRALVKDGKLDRLREGVLAVEEEPKIQVYGREDG